MTAPGERRIIAIDGHDGTGKSTIARLLAERLGGIHVSPYSGTLGQLLAWSWQTGQFELADTVARAAVRKVLEQSPEDTPLVFDRHWLTVFSVIPEEYWSRWFPQPFTVLCWVDVETTYARLAGRGEPIDEADRHPYYCSLYRELAERFRVPIVDTARTTPEESVRSILALISGSAR